MSEKNPLTGLILEGTHFEGKLSFQNKMRIDGSFQGEMDSTSTLIVGKSARIKGELRVAEIVVLGLVEGTISNCNILEIQDGGRVMANVNVKTLDIRPGGVLDGRCEMQRENVQKMVKVSP